MVVQRERRESMELTELTTYARDKYGIAEEHKWTNFPGFSVLCHPETGKWVALLIRQWDTDTGTEIQHCDLKCGEMGFLELMKPWIVSPVRMKGDMWTGISFTRETDPDLVFRLFDRAIANGYPPGATIVLDEKPSAAKRIWKDTLLPLAETLVGIKKPGPPEKLRQMRRLYEYGRESTEAKARNFYRQGKFMEDYEDNYPWEENFVCYFPTYHDMTTDQLRGYFTWRTDFRKGSVYPISASAIYLYIYELLNGIGAVSPEDALSKLRDFEDRYLGAGLGDTRMRSNLHRWMLDLAVVSGLPCETARQYADPELMKRDMSLSVLKNPSGRSDEDIFEALLEWGGKKYADTPVLKAAPERGRRLFSDAWRIAAKEYRKGEKSLFVLCFGLPPRRRWEPFSNAVYYWREKPTNRVYPINECRTYACEGGQWSVNAYEKLYFDRELLQGFLHQTDLMLRRYLKTGRYLKEKSSDAWASPYINQAIEKDKKAVIEAARPKITLDLGGLDRIRRDALTTQNSLLTEEELGGTAFSGEPDYAFPHQAPFDPLPAASLQPGGIGTAAAESSPAALVKTAFPAISQASSFAPVAENTTPAPDLFDFGLSRPAADAGLGAAFPGLLSVPGQMSAPGQMSVPGQTSPARQVSAPGQMSVPGQMSAPGQVYAPLQTSAPAPALSLDELHLQILRALLAGNPVDGLIKENHLMPSIVADTINEALFDELGDTAVSCDDDCLSLVEDYIEDLTTLLGGT